MRVTYEHDLLTMTITIHSNKKSGNSIGLNKISGNPENFREFLSLNPLTFSVKLCDTEISSTKSELTLVHAWIVKIGIIIHLSFLQ